MSIAFDSASNSGYQSGSTGFSWSHTCTGSDLCLFVGVSLVDFTAGNISVTYNGVAMTSVGAASDAGTINKKAELFRLVNPATGSNTVAVTIDSANDAVGGAVSFTGVDQTTPTEAGEARATTGNDGANVITTTTADCWAIDLVATNYTPISPKTADQTSRMNVTGANGSAGISTRTQSPPGNIQLGWGANPLPISDWALYAVAIVPASLPAVEFPRFFRAQSAVQPLRGAPYHAAVPIAIVEPTLHVEPTQAWSVSAKASTPPPVRAPGASIVKPTALPPDGPEFALGYHTVPVARGRFPERHTNRSQISLTWEPGAIGFEAWAIQRRPTPRPPHRGSLLTAFVAPQTGPTFALFTHRAAIQPRYPAARSTFSLPPELDTAAAWGVVRAGGRTLPLQSARSWYALPEDTHKPQPWVTMTRGRPLPPPARSWYTLPEEADRTPHSLVTLCPPRLAPSYRPTQSVSPILEPTTTGITTVSPWPIITRPVVLLHRGPSSVLFFAPQPIDTSTRQDRRNITGKSVYSQAGTGSNLSSRTSTGGNGSRTGTGRPPNR